jgi:large subunit ribosomal protein L5
MNKLKQYYIESVRQKLKEDLHRKNIIETPQLTKIVVNMGVRGAVMDHKLIDRMSGILSKITGQKPKLTRARQSIAGFKIRKGDPIGLMVTLRGDRMYAFFDKLVRIVLPRLKDFHGVKRTSFDAVGNYTLGLTEYSVFPEIDPSEVDRLQGMEISFVTTARNAQEGIALLTALGMPFAHESIRKE